jgi:hypothetical protein
MTMATDPRSPIVQAEQARQVVGVLTWIERRYAMGEWCRGARFGPSGGMCLIGGIDEATDWTLDGVAQQTARELARRLPAPLRLLGRAWPRMALALYNDYFGGRTGAFRLVRRTRFELGGISPQPPHFVDAPAFDARTPAGMSIGHK